MRPPVLALLLLAACGSVRLGEEEPATPRDFDAAHTIDGGLPSELNVLVTVSPVDAGCSACMELGATASGGTPPYSFAWSDDIRLSRRAVCATDGQDALYVVATDALGHKSSQHWVRVDLSQQDCVDAHVPKLCLQNGSFEGTAAVNTAGVFDAEPWSDCTNPSIPNFPHIVNDSVKNWVTENWVKELPAPTDGSTYLGLQEGNQTSQPLCETLRPGDTFSFRVDARKLDISGATGDDTEQVFLSAWSGLAASCARNNLLWLSPPLTTEWTNFCVTVTPQDHMDRLFLRTMSDDSQFAVVFLTADNLVPVPSCP
jgi:hypothetical protein